MIDLLYESHAVPQEIRARVAAVELANPPAERIVFEVCGRHAEPVLGHDGLQLIPVVVFERLLSGGAVAAQLAHEPPVRVILKALVLEHPEPVVFDVATRVVARYQVRGGIPAEHLGRLAWPRRLLNAAGWVVTVVRRPVALIALLDDVASRVVLPLLGQKRVAF